jgi:hypothetical protein
MNSGTQHIGAPIAQALGNCAHSRVISGERLHYVQYLLFLLETDSQVAMLRTTAGHVAQLLQVFLDQLTIQEIVNLSPSFNTYLKGRKY